MSSLDLYYLPGSGPCRCNILTARALGLEVNFKLVDLQKKEQFKPEFLSLNPQHCVPTLVDGDLVLWESKAISCYLANRYGKNDSLYPKNPKARALVDKMLYFEMGTLYSRFAQYVYPVLFTQVTPEPEKLEKIHEALGWLEGFLEGQQYSAGSVPTIADHALFATVTSITAVGIPLVAYPRVVAWEARCRETLPGAAENDEGAQQFSDFAKPVLEARKRR